MLQTIKLLGVTITAETGEKILEYVVSCIQDTSKKLFIITPNPEILVYASSHLAYRDKLNTADVALPDGVGVLLGGRIMGKPLKERVTGVDFIEMLCRESKEKPVSMGFLGGRGGVAERTVERLKSRYPWLNVVFVAEEWSEEGFKIKDLGFKNTKEGDLKSSILNPKSIDILFVAYGAPKQEEWIYENLPKLPIKAAMGVGGAFDYLSGDVHRAPTFIRAIGMEWLFRLFVQPWRFKRQLSLFTFLFLLLKERLSGAKSF